MFFITFLFWLFGFYPLIFCVMVAKWLLYLQGLWGRWKAWEMSKIKSSHNYFKLSTVKIDELLRNPLRHFSDFFCFYLPSSGWWTKAWECQPSIVARGLRCVCGFFTGKRCFPYNGSCFRKGKGLKSSLVCRAFPHGTCMPEGAVPRVPGKG